MLYRKIADFILRYFQIDVSLHPETKHYIDYGRE